MGAEYPKRESHFAHKLVRLMIRTCAAQEITANGFLLVTIIAHTEDAKRYTAPVTYWNGQLMSILGFESCGKLDRARKAAMDAGWLHYDAGGKGKVGRYWTMIPARYSEVPDGPADCDAHVIFSADGQENGKEPLEKRETNERETETFIPSPIPSPSCNEAASRPALKPAKREVAEIEKHVYPVFGCSGGKASHALYWTLTQEFINELAEAFPGVDVPAECRKAHVWVRTKWSSRKTADGMGKFLMGWMQRQQNSGRGGNHSQPKRATSTPVPMTAPEPRKDIGKWAV